jgi:hypothetical protein
VISWEAVLAAVRHKLHQVVEEGYLREVVEANLQVAVG